MNEASDVGGRDGPTRTEERTSRAFVERHETLVARAVGGGVIEDRARGGTHGWDGDDLGRRRRVLVKDNGTQGERRVDDEWGVSLVMRSRRCP